MRIPIIKIKSSNTLFFLFGIILTWYCILNIKSDNQFNNLMVSKTIGKFQLQPFFFDNKLVVKKNNVIDVEILFDDYNKTEKYIFYNSFGKSIVIIERINQNDWVLAVTDIYGNRLEDIDFDGIFDIRSNNGYK